MWENTNHKTWIGNGEAGAGVRLGDRMRSSQSILSARDTLRGERKGTVAQKWWGEMAYPPPSTDKRQGWGHGLVAS